MRFIDAAMDRLMQLQNNPYYSFGEEAVIYCWCGNDRFVMGPALGVRLKHCKKTGRERDLKIRKVFTFNSPNTDGYPIHGEVLQFCEENGIQNLIVHSPCVIGADNEEVVATMCSLLMAGSLRVLFAHDEETTSLLHDEAIKTIGVLLSEFERLSNRRNPGTGPSDDGRSPGTSSQCRQPTTPTPLNSSKKERLSLSNRETKATNAPETTNLCVGCQLSSH